MYTDEFCHVKAQVSSNFSQKKGMDQMWFTNRCWLCMMTTKFPNTKLEMF